MPQAQEWGDGKLRTGSGFFHTSDIVICFSSVLYTVPLEITSSAIKIFTSKIK